MKNDLRQSVDRAFAGAAWDETHARRVISKIEERKQPVMKRKLTAALVCALVLVLASACALAAVFVQRSERSNVVLTARNALTRQYRCSERMRRKTPVGIIPLPLPPTKVFPKRCWAFTLCI